MPSPISQGGNNEITTPVLLVEEGLVMDLLGGQVGNLLLRIKTVMRRWRIKLKNG